MRDRFLLLRKLIRTEPDRALALVFPEDVLAHLRHVYPSATERLEKRGQWEGRAFALVQESKDMRSGSHLLRMHTSAGDINIHPRRFASILPGTRTYRVEGVRAGNDVAAETLIPLDASPAADTCTTTGLQKTIALLVRLPDTPDPTFTESQAEDWIFGTNLSPDGYLRDASFGKTGT